MGLATGAILVIGISNRHDSSRERNILSTKLIGVASAIPVFVVVANDGTQIPQKGQAVPMLLGEVIEDCRAAHRMRLILVFVAWGAK